MPARILLIDDHDVTLKVIRDILLSQGYDVETATLGTEGLELLEQNPPDLVLLDISMPQMSGFEVLKRIRNSSSTPSVPVIMFTGTSSPENKLEGFALGANDFIVKPTSPKELLARIEIQLNRAETPIEEMPIKEMAEEAQKSDAGIVAPPSSRFVEPLPEPPSDKNVIVVLGARGGGGTTTAAINLSTALGLQGHQTALVDLDQIQGHVALYLQQENNDGLNKIATAYGSLLQNRVHEHWVDAGNKLKLLLTTSNLDEMQPMLQASQIPDLISAIAGTQEYTVIDMGRGLSSVGRAVLSEATVCILCLTPDRLSLTVTRQLLTELNQQFPHLSIQLILLDFWGRADLPVSSIETFLGFGISQMIAVSISHLISAVNTGKALVLAEPKSATSQQFHQFITQLVQMRQRLTP